MRITLYLFGILLLTISCRKEKLEDYNSDWAGYWVTSDSIISSTTGQPIENYLNVDGSNSEFGFVCEKNCTVCGCDKLFTGTFYINRKHTKIIIRGGGDRSTLSVDKEPYLDNGVWRCKLEGNAYVKQ